MRKAREADRTFLKETVAYSVSEVGSGENRLPPLQVGQASINLSYDVFKIFSCTTEFISHQVSTCRCLQKTADLQQCLKQSMLTSLCPPLTY